MVDSFAIIERSIEYGRNEGLLAHNQMLSKGLLHPDFLESASPEEIADIAIRIAVSAEDAGLVIDQSFAVSSLLSEITSEAK